MSLKITNVYYIDRRKGRTTQWPNLNEEGQRDGQRNDQI
jgi:hypothetical protein